MGRNSTFDFAQTPKQIKKKKKKRFRQPSDWYFTSSSGEIKRKNKSNMTNAKIYEGFLKKAPDSVDVVAMYLHRKGTVSTPQTQDSKSNESSDPTTVIEYFNRATLCEYFTRNGMGIHFLRCLLQ